MIGKTVSGYTIRRHLGKGGMADVYCGENRLGLKAAIKILKKKYSDEPSVLGRFIKEAKIMVSLQHPNIRKALDLGYVDKMPAIIMEYLDGMTLKDLIDRKGKISNSMAKQYFAQCISALSYTAEKNIVHRDIKPSNIFITNENTVKIMDFGIAKSKEGIRYTVTGQTLGTIIYMSPEQIKDPKRVTSKTDIYSLGVTFYHALTGTLPYDRSTGSDFEILTRIVNERLDLDLIKDSGWRRILEACLEKDPVRRIEAKDLLLWMKSVAISGGGDLNKPQDTDMETVPLAIHRRSSPSQMSSTVKGEIVLLWFFIILALLMIVSFILQKSS